VSEIYAGSKDLLKSHHEHSGMGRCEMCNFGPGPLSAPVRWHFSRVLERFSGGIGRVLRILSPERRTLRECCSSVDDLIVDGRGRCARGRGRPGGARRGRRLWNRLRDGLLRPVREEARPVRSDQVEDGVPQGEPLRSADVLRSGAGPGPDLRTGLRSVRLAPAEPPRQDSLEDG